MHLPSIYGSGKLPGPLGLDQVPPPIPLYFTDSCIVDPSNLYEMGGTEIILGSIMDVIWNLINSAHRQCHASITTFVP